MGPVAWMIDKTLLQVWMIVALVTVGLGFLLGVTQSNERENCIAAGAALQAFDDIRRDRQTKLDFETLRAYHKNRNWYNEHCLKYEEG